MISSKTLRLYAVTDRTWLGDRSLKECVQAAIDGGATLLQVREKHMDKNKYIEEIRELKVVAQAAGIPVIVDDAVDVALAADADGVHIGQSDGDAAAIRKHIGADKILGVSARTVEQALKAQEDGADYLGVGAVFGSSTKEDARAIDHTVLKAICDAVDIPVVAIGGIDENNIERLAGTGVDGVAVISALFAKEDIQEAAARLRKKSEAMVKQHG